MEQFNPNDDQHRPWLLLRYPEARERERMKSQSVRGYIESRGQIVPLDDWQENQVLDVPNGTASNQRSIARMAQKAGYKVTSKFEGEHLYFLLISRTGGVKPHPTSTTLYLRPWDRAMSIPQLALARRTRESPTGVPHEVEYVMRAGQYVAQYPWAKMKEGDFFIVAMKHGNRYDKRVYLNTFRMAACRHDIEIQVVDFNVNVRGEEKKGLRVTMVQRGLAALKKKAADLRGERILVSNGGKKKPRRTARDATLEKKAIAALVAMGVDEEQAKTIVAANRKTDDEGREGRVGVPDVLEGNAGGGRAAREGDERDSADDDHREPTPSVEVVDHLPDVREERGCYDDSDEDDDGGVVDLFEGRFNPEAPQEPEPTKLPRSPRIWAADEPREVDTRGLSEEFLKGSAYSPDYDRAAIMKQRLAALKDK